MAVDVGNGDDNDDDDVGEQEQRKCAEVFDDVADVCQENQDA